MIRRALVVGVAVVVAGGVLLLRRARTPACKPASDPTAETLLANMGQLASSDASRDSLSRVHAKLPRTEAINVVVVTNTALCKRAVVAFNGAVRGIWPSPVSLALVRVDSVYVATYPTRGHYWPHVVFDSSFHVLAKFPL